MNCLIFLQFIKNTNFKNANNSLLIHYKQLLKFINKLPPKTKKSQTLPRLRDGIWDFLNCSFRKIRFKNMNLTFITILISKPFIIQF